MEWPRRVPRCCLRAPDAVAWHHEAGYSHATAGALWRVYDLLDPISPPPHTDSAYGAALATLLPRSTRRMSPHQRLVMESTLGRVYMGQDDLPSALDHLDVALDVAERLADAPAQVELASAAGAASRMLTHFMDAHDYYTAAATAARALDERGDPAIATIELDLLIRLAGMDFELARFAAVEPRLSESRTLLGMHALDARVLPAAREAIRLQEASLAWIEADLEWWRGNLERALRTGMEVAEIYARGAAPGASARIHLVVADIALDLAKTFSRDGASYAGTAWVRLAQSYARRGAQLTRVTHDPIGEGLARLALHRCQRAARRGDGAVDPIEAVMRRAKQLNDMSLLGRAQTALGDAFAARGERESALNCYRQARHVLERHHLHALAMWPQRALLYASEF